MKHLSASQFYKSLFGCKAYKIALDAGCTCPNRDGTKGRGGCIFCSQNGSGDFTPERNLSIAAQIDDAKRRIEHKLRGRSGKNPGLYIAYFQNFTSTYGDEDSLIQKFRETVSQPEVAGLSIATRPDCLSDSMIQKILAISKGKWLSIELGLQTSNDETARKINRCYKTSEYDDCVRRIHAADKNIHVVTHLIFGLPGESEPDMMESLRHALAAGTDGIKITILYVVRGTELANLYNDGKYDCLSKEAYYSLLEKALKIIPESTVIHRLTGDPPKSIMLAPDWTRDKKRVMNEIRLLLEKSESL